MADNINKDKQSKLDSFVSQTPKASNKRDQRESSPDWNNTVNKLLILKSGAYNFR
jgi:hypothetical protein